MSTNVLLYWLGLCGLDWFVLMTCCVVTASRNTRQTCVNMALEGGDKKQAIKPALWMLLKKGINTYWLEAREMDALYDSWTLVYLQ